MQQVTPGQTNIVLWDCDSRVTGEPIEDGTLALYLYCTKGDYQEQWWSGSAWSLTEVSCGLGSHVSRGHWKRTLEAAAFTSLAEFGLYGVHSSGLQSDYTEEIITLYEGSSGGLSGLSSLDDAITQYNDNLDWDGNVAKAKAALQAARFLVANRLQAGTARSKSFNYESLEPTTKEIKAFLTARDTSASARGASFVKGRATIL